MNPRGVLSVLARPVIGLIILASAAFTASCGGDSGTAPSPSSLAGTWAASYAQFTSVATPTQSIELIAQGGTITLALASGGSFTETTTRPGQPTDVTTGTWTASADVLTLQPTGASFNVQFNMTFSGNSLTLNGGHVQFDINLDSVDEEAILNMRMTRQ